MLQVVAARRVAARRVGVLVVFIKNITTILFVVFVLQVVAARRVGVLVVFVKNIKIYILQKQQFLSSC